MKKLSLTKQLIYICILIVGIIFIALGIILPNKLLPIYEENIYNKLKQPLTFIRTSDDIDNITIVEDTDIAYIYQTQDLIFVSRNINDVIKDFDTSIIKYTTNKYGKIIYKNRLYYYYRISNSKNESIISITNDKYVNDLEKDTFHTILLITGLSFTLCSLILIVWSNNLVNDIIILKKKIKNIDNDNFNITLNHNFEDEIYSLNESIESMHEYLMNNESYKNQLYQNISHDFKTPITVMKSYIEASEDGVETKEKTLDICKEQLNKLEVKVHSLLYLNKLNYFSQQKDSIKRSCDVSKIILASVEKFTPSRSDVEFVLDIDKKNVIFRGSEEMWEAIIDNILNNFMRYARTKIKITVKNNKIILYNDGPNIDKTVLNNIFTPYEKGVNGVFGLGLSIVKKTLLLLNYDINITNEKNGVKFIIS